MQYTATINWKRETPDFEVKTYDRSHKVEFGGGIAIDASSAPEFAGKKELVNPEELFTASIASCLMLTFLYIAAMKKLTVDAYECQAVGKLGKNSEGKMAMIEVVLTPKISFAEAQPSAEVLKELLDKAHEQCFISSSVKTQVTIA